MLKPFGLGNCPCGRFILSASSRSTPETAQTCLEAVPDPYPQQLLRMSPMEFSAQGIKRPYATLDLFPRCRKPLLDPYTGPPLNSGRRTPFEEDCPLKCRYSLALLLHCSSLSKVLSSTSPCPVAVTRFQSTLLQNTRSLA